MARCGKQIGIQLMYHFCVPLSKSAYSAEILQMHSIQNNDLLQMSHFTLNSFDAFNPSLKYYFST